MSILIEIWVGSQHHVERRRRFASSLVTIEQQLHSDAHDFTVWIEGSISYFYGK